MKTRLWRNFAIEPWGFSLAKASTAAGFYSGREHSDAVAGAWRVTASLRSKVARKWLAEVGLQDRAGHRAGELSGGEQQRVAICSGRSSQGPRVLLADEPTGDLDEQNAWAVFELLERLHRTHRLTSLIATHNLALAARCDRVVGLEHGVLRTRSVRAEATGTPGGEEAS